MQVTEISQQTSRTAKPKFTQLPFNKTTPKHVFNFGFGDQTLNTAAIKISAICCTRSFRRTWDKLMILYYRLTLPLATLLRLPRPLATLLRLTRPLAEVEAMPIGLEEWRAGVGSNNAARSHALGRRKCPRSFLSQLISYLVALFTEGTWFTSNNGELGI